MASKSDPFGRSQLDEEIRRILSPEFDLSASRPSNAFLEEPLLPRDNSSNSVNVNNVNEPSNPNNVDNVNNTNNVDYIKDLNDVCMNNFNNGTSEKYFTNTILPVSQLHCTPPGQRYSFFSQILLRRR